MSLSRFQLPYLSSSERTAIIPLDRDLIYDTDLRQIFVGDGLTLGGIPITVALSTEESIKTTGIDAGYFGQESLMNDYQYKCVYTGTAETTLGAKDGTAIWKKTILFKT